MPSIPESGEPYNPPRDSSRHSRRPITMDAPPLSNPTPTAQLLEVVTILTRNQSRLRLSVDTLLDQQKELLELVDSVITRNEEVVTIPSIFEIQT